MEFKTASCIVIRPRIPFTNGGRDLSLSDETGKVEIVTTKRSVGRPKTITDMKAYKAKWAREYRARKASKSNPNTPERNDE